jgi:hypothetical protein
MERSLRPAHSTPQVCCLPAHAVKGVTKAVLAWMTNVKPGGYEGATFTPLFVDGTFRTGRKVHDPQRKGILSY